MENFNKINKKENIDSYDWHFINRNKYYHLLVTAFLSGNVVKHFHLFNIGNVLPTSICFCCTVHFFLNADLFDFSVKLFSKLNKRDNSYCFLHVYFFLLKRKLSFYLKNVFDIFSLKLKNNIWCWNHFMRFYFLNYYHHYYFIFCRRNTISG